MKNNSAKFAYVSIFPNFKSKTNRIKPYVLWLLLDCGFYLAHDSNFFFPLSLFLLINLIKWESALNFISGIYASMISMYWDFGWLLPVNAHDTNLIPFDFSDDCWQQWIELQFLVFVCRLNQNLKHFSPIHYFYLQFDLKFQSIAHDLEKCTGIIWFKTTFLDELDQCGFDSTIKTSVSLNSFFKMFEIKFRIYFCK